MEDIRYYNRYTGREEREQVPGEKYMQWIYGTASGKAALHVLIKRGVFFPSAGLVEESPFQRPLHSLLCGGVRH